MASSDLPALDKRYGRRIREAREQRGVTQAKLVAEMKALGVDYMNTSTLSRIEVGTRPVRLTEAQVIGRILGASVEEMIAEDNARQLHLRMLDVRRALLQAQDVLRGAEADWAAAVVRGREVLREAERPRLDGDEEIRAFISNLARDIEQLIERGPDDVPARGGSGATAAERFDGFVQTLAPDEIEDLLNYVADDVAPKYREVRAAIHGGDIGDVIQHIELEPIDAAGVPLGTGREKSIRGRNIRKGMESVPAKGLASDEP